MCRKLIYPVCFVLVLVASPKLQAQEVVPFFSDDFNTPHNYLTGLGNYDGMVGLGECETVDALNASIDRAGQLYIESTNGAWAPPWCPLGPFLYKVVEGDFIATVELTDYAGTADEWVFHNDGGLMARASRDPDVAGPGEDWLSIDYFPIWNCGNFVWVADNNERDELGHNGLMWDAHKYLQLERSGNTFIFRTSADGENWVEMLGASPITRDDFDGLPLQVGLRQCTYSDATGYAAFDNFSIIPEPATIALLGLGGLALIRRKRA